MITKIGEEVVENQSNYFEPALAGIGGGLIGARAGKMWQKHYINNDPRMSAEYLLKCLKDIQNKSGKKDTAKYLSFFNKRPIIATGLGTVAAGVPAYMYFNRNRSNRNDN